ncbi:MAG: FHA domain-containing protein [Sulfolobaceae archaeon]|nr:FHA domain-containing protein [Sulfolobaceae archaeon]
MPWKCPVCGTENDDNVLYCTNCGAKRPEQVSPQPESVSAQQQSNTSAIAQQVQEQSQQPEQSLPQQQSTPEQSAPKQPEQNAQQVVVPQQPVSVSNRYYIIFIASPVESLIKTKLPLDFETFPNISIGRSPENVIVIPDPAISRKHALISLENNEVFIEDLNSTNGTWLYDGKQFQPIKSKTKLDNNAVIKLGNSTIVKFVKE